ncbi:probable fibrosin-1 isoform X2 [Protopterus annectens]|uniref:probable fibrosin-1 isoform X2 n=1 Tax=Protopterus annectens TaxID=7888 RepID=UPI001CFBB673|nr:probable fibrosin-1 isoform X2 [Protopterus annectens]
METPHGGGYRQSRSRRSRSQRDLESGRLRRVGRGRSASGRSFSPTSSGSDRETALQRAAGPPPRPRPPRRRKKESSSGEEDLIDGFAIASFISLEALEKDNALKPPERLEQRLKHTGKRKRKEEPVSEHDDHRGESTDRDHSRANGQIETRKRMKNKKSKRERKSSRGSESDVLKGESGRAGHSNSQGIASDASPQSLLETGYICDTESDSEEKASDDDLDRSFTISASKAVEPNGALNGNCETKLSVIPKVSGLERSQERNAEPEKDPLLVPFLPKESPAQATSSSQTPVAGPMQVELSSSTSTQVRPPTLVPSRAQTPVQTAARTTPQPKPQTPQNLPQPQSQTKVHPFNPQASMQQTVSVYAAGITVNSGSRSNTPAKPVVPTSQAPQRPPTPSVCLTLNSHTTTHSFPSIRAQPHPQPNVFPPSGGGLPPPPPLLQVAGHPAAAAVAAAALSDPDLLRHELSSRFLTSQERGGTIGPLAFQFHQHNHQHQHTHQHTHQHFTPYASIVPPPAPPMFEKCLGGKIDSLYRHNFYPTFPPTVSGIQPVLPTAVPFGSLQGGAFQPKTPNPELPTRLGAVPPTMPQKDPRITDPYRSAVRLSHKPGKWCAMHVRVAYMILQHQKKMKGESHKLDLRNDLVLQQPSLSTAHDLSRPATIFTAAGTGHPSGNPFGQPSASHTGFLNPSSHFDTLGRSSGFSPLCLPNGAFGGLANQAIGSSTVFGHKESPNAQGYGSIHDSWNRLHRTPPSFPTPPASAAPWVKPGDAERNCHEREREVDKREVVAVKDEKDRDALYARQLLRVSPVIPSHKSAAVHTNGRSSVDDERSHGCSDGRDRERMREREREHLDASKDPFQHEHKVKETHLLVEENLGLVKRLVEDSSKMVARDHSPYIRTPAGESSRPCSSTGRETERKPELPLEQTLRKVDVKVKEERKDEQELAASGFEVAPSQRANNSMHPVPLHAIAAGHSGVPLAMHVAPPAVHHLSVFERPRVLSPYLTVGPPVAAGERFAPQAYSYEPAWREPYRNVEMHRIGRELLRGADPLQRLTNPRFFDHERAYRERDINEFARENLLDPRREAERSGLIEDRASILREDYERARLFSLHPSALEAHIAHPTLLQQGLGGLAYPRFSHPMAHQNGILSKTPPINLLSTPPPLIPSTSTRPPSPRRTTPLTAELRDLSAAYKDRDSR